MSNNNQNSHVVYTRNELNDYPYYVEMLKIMEKEPVKTYMDIGANTGEFHNIIVKRIPTIEETYLFEPDYNNFMFMKQHTTKQGVKRNLFKTAISYSIKEGKLSASHSVGGYQVEPLGVGGKKIEIATLESLNLPVVDFVKMDVEGMEFEILRKSSYLKNVLWLDVEFHQTPEQGNDSFVKKFLDENFDTHDIIYSEEQFGRCLLKKK